jgi:hypothetical protein
MTPAMLRDSEAVRGRIDRFEEELALKAGRVVFLRAVLGGSAVRRSS